MMFQMIFASDPASTPTGGMGFTDTVAALLSLTALFAYLNHRFVRLPATVGVMALALAFSLSVTAIGLFVPSIERTATRLVAGVDFNQTVLHGMLGFLLFAGTLHVDLKALSNRWFLIAMLATVGVVVSTLIVGSLAYGLLAAVGLPARPIYCLMFGAIVTPTDPIAVLAMLKQVGAPKELEATITGESLFNDGVGVVVFLGLLQAAVSGHDLTVGHLGWSFLQEGVGGAAFGAALGFVFYFAFKSVDAYQVEVLLSLALVAGGYALAERIHVSAPIAMVIAGLVIGNPGRTRAMSETTRDRLDGFWELIDEILNAVLFVLIGLEVLALKFSGKFLLIGMALVPVVLAARFLSVAGPVTAIRPWRPIPRYTIRLLTWGGLRGGLSVAMALAVPVVVHGEKVLERDWILSATYIVVAFSILVQGTTISSLMKRWIGRPDEKR
jgi:monovalent cation:H+ antiporter, CPA1 family